jgi:hypothetical protein
MKIEAPVAEVIRRACRTSSKARYQTADEFLAALRHAFDDPEWEVTTRTASPVSGDPSSSQSDGAVEWTQTGGPTRSRKSTGKPTRSSPPSRSGSPRLRGPRLPVDPLADEGEVLVGGRRLRLLEVDDDLVVGDFESCPISTPARIRISFPPFADHSPQLHIKGLNAFIVKDGGRPSGGVNITSDADLALISPARDPIDFVRFSFGILEGTTRLLEFAEVILEVQLLQIAWVVAVDFGPGRDAALLYHRRK